MVGELSLSEIEVHLLGMFTDAFAALSAALRDRGFVRAPASIVREDYLKTERNICEKDDSSRELHDSRR